MSKEKNPPMGPRMSSSVRIRRHHGSRLTNFLERHFGDGKEEEIPPDSAQSNNTSGTAEPLRRPRLGTLEGEGRRASGRSISAVERLAAEDRASFRTTSSGGPSTKSSAKTTGGRATDGHKSELTRVSEDVSPTGGRGDSTAHYFDPIEEDEAESGHDHFTTSIEGSGSNQRPQSFSTPKKPAPVISNAAGKSNALTDSNDSSQQSGETHFLTPRSDRSSTPEGEAASGSPSNSRLRRNQAQVSIPTPVREEERVELDEQYDDQHHTDDVADYLDVIDPEVGALGYLNNIGNSIFLPNIPALYDRRPTHHLPSSRRRGYSLSSVLSQRRTSVASSRSRRSQDSSGAMEEGVIGSTETTDASKVPATSAARPTMLRRVTSAVGWKKKDEDEEFVKHIKDWRDMDEEERDELDDHVNMLLTKKSKFKRGAKGFYAFTKTPMGFVMTLYGFLVTFWGTAIVLFIFGWIHVGHRKRYWIEICDQILCALFACVGLGFAPFRAVDTYHMIHIAHYNRLTQRRRKELGLKELTDPNDLPRPEADGSNQVSKVVIRAEDRGASFARGTTFSNSTSFTDSRGSLLTPVSTDSTQSQTDSQNKKKHKKHLIHHKKILALPDEVHRIVDTAQADKEEEDPIGLTGDLSKGRNGRPAPMKRNESIQSEIVKEREDVVVLTEGEQAVLEHHQRKFHASHHYFRYHETSTHRAFPLDLMIVITCLLDCHSILQGALGGCTWGIKYTHRPTALTATIITCSLSCNAVAGLIIWIGGRRTKKKEEVERRLRIALEQEALAKIERRRARGELPERERPRRTPAEEEKAYAEEKVAAHHDRDRIIKDLGHLEGKPTSTFPTKNDDQKRSNNIEMSAIRKTLSEK